MRQGIKHMILFLGVGVVLLAVPGSASAQGGVAVHTGALADGATYLIDGKHFSRRDLGRAEVLLEYETTV